MHYCSSCGHPNPDEAEICQKCAAMMKASCPSCGQSVPAGTRFCGHCGAPLPADQVPQAASSYQDQTEQTLRALMPTALAAKINAAATEVHGERREVTVLFVDIANFTAAAHELDSEDVFLLTDEALRLLAEVVYKYEGTIDKYTGDGLMALFGAPVAHENDPERAVRAALEMQAALLPMQARAKQRYGLDFEARIGINTGTVIAGQVGNDLHMEYTVIGDTVNLAARMEMAAEPGTVLVSFATYQRTRPLFRYHALPPLEVKGIPDPVRAFRPMGLRPGPRQVRGLPGSQVPMIGRHGALVQLQNALNEVRQHHCSRIALVTGEAGVGKSRLVTEFLSRETQSDTSFYQGMCQNYTRLKPLWLIASLLREILHLSETDPPEVQRRTLQTYVRQLGLTSNDLLPYLINALALEQSDPQTEALVRKLDSTALLKLTHAALRQVLMTEARLGPTVLIFEDLHWVDPASRDFLEYFIQTLDDVPLMLLLISRDLEKETVIQPLIAASEKRQEQPIDIRLNPLSETEGQLLVDHLLQTTDEPLALKQHIVERAEGNPFYAEETVRMLIEEGGLEFKEGNWQVTPLASELMHKVPGTLKGLILARFDRLPASLRRTLQKASALGPLFPLSLLQSLNGADPNTIAEQIRTLEAHQFLAALSFDSGENYAFRHALIQEVVYSTLLKRDRKAIHEQIAQVIEQSRLWTQDERTETLAYHYAEGLNPIQAIPYLITSAENAARRCAHEIAIQRYRQALTLMQDLPGQQSWTPTTDKDDKLVRAHIGLGQALKFVGEFAQASQVLEQALQSVLHLSATKESIYQLPSLIQGLRELADIRIREGALDQAVEHLQAGLDALGVENTQEYPELWRLLMDRLAWVRFRQGKLEEAFGLASSATLGLNVPEPSEYRLGMEPRANGEEERENPMTLASLYNTLGGIFWQWGNLTEAADYVRSSLELYQSMGYAWGMAIAYTNLGILNYAQGTWPQATEYFERAYTLRRENGYLPEQALNLNNLGLLRLAMGDHDQARKDLETSRAIAQRLGDDFGVLLAEVGLAQLAVIQSRLEEATSHIEVVLDLPDVAGSHQTAHALWLLGLVQAEQGDLQAGLESAERALQMAREAGITEMEASCRRALGVLRARAGDYLEAETLLRESADLCLQVNTPYDHGLALLQLGRIYHQLAQDQDLEQAEWREKALTTLNEAVAQFDHLGANHDLQLARTALDQLQAEMAIEMPPSQDQVVQTALTLSHPHPELPEGEWRTVAIVWLNLNPPPDADEEDIFETLARVNLALVAIAQEHHGQVVRRPDGLTVIFGAPAAYEDDAERAVATAWYMAQYLTEPVHPLDVPLTFSLAVNQGDVVAGQLDSVLHAELVVKGEPVQVAQHIAESTPPGKVWVTEAVHAATERLFIYQPAPASFAAKLADLTLLELVGWQARPRPARGLPELKTRLIGRESALQAMTGLFQNLDRAIGGLIWIEGEPGIGKSRLIREFEASINTNGTTVWAGRSVPQKTSYAFALFTDLLSQALNVQPTDTPDQVRTKIHQTIRNWPTGTQVTGPYLEMLLGLKPGGSVGERLAGLEPEQLRQQTFVILRRLFKSLASEHPLVILLDDLHWVDPVSAELLLFLVTLVASDPILFVCAQRRQGADQPNDRLVRVQSLLPTQTVRLRLDRLSSTESEVLLSELLHQTTLPQVLRSTILERSEGNPYFIEEFIRMLIEQGYLRQRRGRWEVDPDLDLTDLSLPTSLDTLIRSRIDTLPQELKQLMQCAAIIGAPFESGLLETISELSNVKTTLRRLESRLLVRRGAETDQWYFNHSMIETVVYNAMLKARRQVLHLQVAQALEKRWVGVEADHAEALAYHFTQAGEGAKALTYLLLAGERAAARYANEEAIAYFEQAAQQLHTQPEAEDSLLWRLAAGLGDAQRALGRFADSKAALEVGLTLVETGGLQKELEAGLLRRLGETAQKQGTLDAAEEHFNKALTVLGDPTDHGAQTEAARILTGLASTYFFQGRFEQAREACEASLAHARRANALNELSTAENWLGGIYFRRNEWTAASHHTTRAMILREKMGYTWGVASTLGNLGILSVSAGQWNKARSFFERSLSLRQEMGDVDGLVLLHNNLGMLARDQGQLDVAEYHFKKSLEIATPFKMGFHIANSTVGLAKVMLSQGKVNAPLEALAISLAQAESIGAKDVLAEVYRVKAEVLLTKSELEEAQAVVERAISLAAETGDHSLEATTWRVASEIKLRQEGPQAARQALNKAQQALLDVTDELESARVAAQSGRIYLAEGEVAQAELDLRVAQEVFMRLGANLDLQRVEEVLKQPFPNQEATGKFKTVSDL